jgi:hypothetical protein
MNAQNGTEEYKEGPAQQALTTLHSRCYLQMSAILWCLLHRLLLYTVKFLKTPWRRVCRVKNAEAFLKPACIVRKTPLRCPFNAHRERAVFL